MNSHRGGSHHLCTSCGPARAESAGAVCWQPVVCCCNVLHEHTSPKGPASLVQRCVRVGRVEETTLKWNSNASHLLCTWERSGGELGLPSSLRSLPGFGCFCGGCGCSKEILVVALKNQRVDLAPNSLHKARSGEIPSLTLLPAVR